MKEAQEKFASSSVTPLPPLPARPVSRQLSQGKNARPARMPRRILPADQIFRSDISEQMSSSTTQSDYMTPNGTSNNASTALTIPSEEPSQTFSLPRQRRVTISLGSPDTPGIRSTIDIESGSPSKRKEKAKSSGDLNSLLRPISSLSTLQHELAKGWDATGIFSNV